MEVKEHLLRIDKKIANAECFVLLIDTFDDYRLFGGVYRTYNAAAIATEKKLKSGHYGHAVRQTYIIPCTIHGEADTE